MSFDVPHNTISKRKKGPPRFENDPVFTKPGKIITYKATPEMIEDVTKRGYEKYKNAHEKKPILIRRVK